MVWRFEVWGTKSVAGDFFRPSAQSSGVSRIVNHSAFVPFASSNYRMDDSVIFSFGRCSISVLIKRSSVMEYHRDLVKIGVQVKKTGGGLIWAAIRWHKEDYSCSSPKGITSILCRRKKSWPRCTSARRLRETENLK